MRIDKTGENIDEIKIMWWEWIWILLLVIWYVVRYGIEIMPRFWGRDKKKENGLKKVLTSRINRRNKKKY